MFFFWVGGRFWRVVHTPVAQTPLGVWPGFLKGSGGPTSGGGPTLRVTMGAGTLVGLVLAIGVVAVFSLMTNYRGKGRWMYLGDGVGLLLGVVLGLVAANI
jgi:hypothetical protein